MMAQSRADPTTNEAVRAIEALVPFNLALADQPTPRDRISLLRAQKLSLLMTSPPAMVASAHQVMLEMVLLTNLTEPSIRVTLTPPVW
jgi:hypothetical protein